MRNWSLVVFLLLAVLTTVACEKSGELESPIPPNSYVGPTISGLQTTTRQLSQKTGGILRLTCVWASPRVVSTATAYLTFVRSLQDPQASPTGVISSGTASSTASTAAAMTIPVEWRAQTATNTASSTSSDAFFTRFQDPIRIPLGIGTDQKEGAFSAEIPFAIADIADAPLGTIQMLLWMMVNNVKTNSLAFEIEIVP